MWRRGEGVAGDGVPASKYRLIDLFLSYCDFINLREREINGNQGKKRSYLTIETQSKIIWSAIKPLIKKYCKERTQWESFNDIHRNLIAEILQLQLAPSPDNEFLFLEEEEDFFTSLVEINDQEYSLALTPWKEIFNRYLRPNMLTKYSKEEIMAYFLIECTFYGCSEASVNNKIVKIKAKMERQRQSFNPENFIRLDSEHFMEVVAESRRRICEEMGMTEEEYEQYLKEQQKINETDYDSETD